MTTLTTGRRLSRRTTSRTHPGHVANNMVIDEEPDYRVDISTGAVRKAVGAYLREIEAPVSTWEAFVQLSTYDAYQSDAAAERDEVDEALKQEPEPDGTSRNLTPTS